ncbi:MAG: sulfurtransferase [Cyanophyceae cyanobacterium]
MFDIQPTVSAVWLAEQLANPQVIVVDCRFKLADPDWGHQQYLNGHIPGAFYLDLNRDLSAPVQRHGGRHPLPNESFAEKLAVIGIIKNRTFVVAYDDSRFAFAARLWWLLRYLGHEPVALLDGGWTGWCQQYPVSQELPEPEVGEFVPQPHREWIADIEAVKRGSSLLIDSRDSDRYRGEREPIDPLAGHIPTAVNAPWKAVSDEQGYLLPLSKQRQLWSDYEGRDLVVYCGSGVTACVNLFSLWLTGHRNVKLYPGGWSDWCSYLEQ